MTSKQYRFSLVVGIALLVLGVAITGQAATGISLIGLGLTIVTLSFLTKHRRHRSHQSVLLPIAATSARQSSIPTAAQQVR
ncbi:hypothetical protein [Spartinivicinus poritis]|uniref:Uncharacterized protein n=1 Tax=Spartinivicinus poritis TaxID=2994640 RepID=A0ABT5U3B7_9GAMM|nr:hypothetical protein [Spartinivicinus sp. A2-2]MDE1460802.1 hypothetical protein [Spartinivicinus sp. A2-2]